MSLKLCVIHTLAFDFWLARASVVVVAGICGLSVSILHQCDGLFADRHDAAHAAREAIDDGTVRHFAHDHRIGHRASRQHPQLIT
jgi:hypothetical protein